MGMKHLPFQKSKARSQQRLRSYFHLLKQASCGLAFSSFLARWSFSCLHLTALGFQPTPLRTAALSQRLRPLSQTVLMQMNS